MFKPGLLIKHDLARYRLPLMEAGSSKANWPDLLERRWEMLPSNSQGSSSQCAAFAAAGVTEYWRWRVLGEKQQIDPAPIYERAKEIDGFPDDEGTTLEAVVRSLNGLGILPVKLDTLKVVRREEVERALHRYGVLLSAFIIHTGWQTSSPDGWIPQGGDVMGGHAVVLTGYDQRPSEKRFFSLQNSWGEVSFGWKGFARMTLEHFQEEFLYGVVFDMDWGAL